MNRQDVNLESRDYDIKSIAEDPRFSYAKREFWVCQVINILEMVILTIICYTLTDNGKTILGFPEWYVIATLFCIAVAAACILYAVKFVKRSKLDAIADAEEERE